jgi:hypothetical protein
MVTSSLPELQESPSPVVSAGKLIEQGERYYSVILGGGGLGWIKRPDRILLDEIDQYLEKWGINTVLNS